MAAHQERPAPSGREGTVELQKIGSTGPSMLLETAAEAAAATTAVVAAAAALTAPAAVAGPAWYHIAGFQLPVIKWVMAELFLYGDSSKKRI
jgi:hypothetical protein